MAKETAVAQEGEVKKKGKGKLIGIVLAVVLAGVGAKFTVLSAGGKAAMAADSWPGRN